LRTFNKLIISLALAFGAIDSFLAFLGQDDLSVYFIGNALAFLIITLIFVYLNPRARSALNALSIIIFAGFLVIVGVKVAEILR
jgi:hypothetical protein